MMEREVSDREKEKERKIESVSKGFTDIPA